MLAVLSSKLFITVAAFFLQVNTQLVSAVWLYEQMVTGQGSTANLPKLDYQLERYMQRYIDYGKEEDRQYFKTQLDSTRQFFQARQFLIEAQGKSYPRWTRCESRIRSMLDTISKAETINRRSYGYTTRSSTYNDCLCLGNQEMMCFFIFVLISIGITCLVCFAIKLGAEEDEFRSYERRRRRRKSMRGDYGYRRYVPYYGSTWF